MESQDFPTLPSGNEVTTLPPYTPTGSGKSFSPYPRVSTEAKKGTWNSAPHDSNKATPSSLSDKASEITC